jgi:transposase-like protein
MSPNQVAVDETMILLNGSWYWLYMAVDTDTNNILHTKLQPTRNHYTAKEFMNEIKNTTSTIACFSSMDYLLFIKRVEVIRSDFRSLNRENRNSVERVFRELKCRTQAFSNSFSNAHLQTADDWLKSFSFSWNMLI